MFNSEMPFFSNRFGGGGARDGFELLLFGWRIQKNDFCQRINDPQNSTAGISPSKTIGVVLKGWK